MGRFHPRTVRWIYCKYLVLLLLKVKSTYSVNEPSVRPRAVSLFKTRVKMQSSCEITYDTIV